MREERNIRPEPAKGVVIACPAPGGEALFAHERRTIIAVAREIAVLKGFAFQEGHGDAGLVGPLYYVPDDSLLGIDADLLGIKGPMDLFGGVFPSRFAMTKVITHELASKSAVRPNGWIAEFGQQVGTAVLPGYSAFSRTDALRAASRLLRLGPVRLKPPNASRGREQQIACTISEVTEFLDRYRVSNLEEHGLVLEMNLHDIMTLSIGMTAIDDIVIVYVGTQRTTTDNTGQHVYGGSDITVMRGEWEALERLKLPRSLATAVAQAKIYDASLGARPGFFASRRNYDVGQGFDSSGTWRSGVFEACWRIGGSSSAELAAIKVLKQDPAVRFVCASTVKAFGKSCNLPADATVHFSGDDPDEGPITRYTVTTGIGRALDHNVNPRS